MKLLQIKRRGSRELATNPVHALRHLRIGFVILAVSPANRKFAVLSLPRRSAA